MKLLEITIILGYLSVGYSYTKYGRTCKDIGCPNNQECVMETDPCSYYHRQGECGSFPTCKIMSHSARTCSTYVCPPSKICRMDGDTPKCFDDGNKVGSQRYDTQNQHSITNNQHAISSSAGNQQSGIYPQIPKRGETTPRPNVYRPVNSNPNGYQGGQIGSGYPGAYPQNTGYPQRPQQAYPQQGAYPQQSSYPRQVYPQQGAYPQQAGYPQQGAYPQQGGYYPAQGNQRVYYPPQTQNNQGTSIIDKLSNSLKNIGGYLKKELGVK